MKAIIIVIFIFCFCNIGFAQPKKLSNGEQIRIKNLVGEWVLTTISQQGSHVSVPVNEANYLNYKDDGSYSDSSNRFKVSSGTWRYDSITRILYTNEVGGKTKVKVVKLTKHELMLALLDLSISVTTHYSKIE